MFNIILINLHSKKLHEKGKKGEKVNRIFIKLNLKNKQKSFITKRKKEMKKQPLAKRTISLSNGVKRKSCASKLQAQIKYLESKTYKYKTVPANPRVQSVFTVYRPTRDIEALLLRKSVAKSSEERE